MKFSKKAVSLTRTLVLTAACALFLEWQASAQVRIMPLGDSLTSSVDGQASYRYWLWNKLQARGLQVDFVGTLWGVGDGASGIYPDFDQNHEGHSGATTEDLLYGVSNWASQQQPDIVLLLAGANDLEQGSSPAQAVANIRSIIDALRSVNPNVAVLVALLPPIPGQMAKEKSFNGALARQARRWRTATSPVRVVNLWSGFNAYKDTVDGQHPNASGEQKYANRFYQALIPVLTWLGRR